jgi:hypothetical protein
MGGRTCFESDAAEKEQARVPGSRQEIDEF